MVKVECKKDNVTFIHQNTFLKLELRIPLENIGSVSAETVEPLWFTGKIESHMPVFWAGTFCTREGKIFYYDVKDRFKCIILKLTNHEYSKVVVEVDDKERVAQNLRERIERIKGPQFPRKLSLRDYIQWRKIEEMYKRITGGSR